MFRRHWLYRARAISSDGFSVDALIGGGQIQYREGNKAALLYADEREGLVDFMIAPPPEWRIGPAREPMSGEDQARVSKRVREALQFLGFTLRDTNTPLQAPDA